VASFDIASGGRKMLRPDARASACRTRVLGVTLGAASSPLDEALHALLTLDPEADTLTDVRVDSWATSVGLFDRSCVTVHANVVRAILVVNLPAPPGHHHEHH
jgi:hypothetical protein